MKLIKLDAIDSTNDFLKGLLKKQSLDNFTVISAEYQTKGRGQMGSVWNSEQGKNIIMSVLLKNFVHDINSIYDINVVVSVSVLQVLEDFNVPMLSIKWPNDIMSYNKKIGGILIENNIKSDGVAISVIGMGLNVNQINFVNLPKASSLAIICKTTFDKDRIILKIIEKLEQNTQNWELNQDFFWKNYGDRLFKIGLPMPFEDHNQKKFMGIIQGVSSQGKLKILLENDLISEYSIKEIQMLYSD